MLNASAAVWGSLALHGSTPCSGRRFFLADPEKPGKAAAVRAGTSFNPPSPPAVFSPQAPADVRGELNTVFSPLTAAVYWKP